MGCFSFKCKESNKPVASSSFDGDTVRMYLLKDGKVIEEMRGQYDSYGRCFDKDMKSMHWNMDWSDVCDLMFSPSNADGIAVILEEHFNGTIPNTQSQLDPEQGWGESESTNPFVEPMHKVY